MIGRSMTGTAVLRTEGVDLVRNGKLLLNGIDIAVQEGEHWALLGPNGAGKSTLLGLLGAVTHPTRGTVHVLGNQLGKVDMRELRSHIGHVNPRHPLGTPLTVFEVVLTGITNTTELVPRWSPSPAERAQAGELLDMLGMAGKREERWPTLSQGERGRTLIARALMPKPRLLLLDEPATGLDLAAREQLLTAIDGLRAGHPELASVLVTHHLEELPASTTHALLLREGAHLASGPAEEVITTELVSECFAHPVEIERTAGRWSARSPRLAAIG